MDTNEAIYPHDPDDQTPLLHDIACIEHIESNNWRVHYRMFVDWDGRVVVCEGVLDHFSTYDQALCWILDELIGVNVVSLEEFYKAKEEVSRYQ